MISRDFLGYLDDIPWMDRALWADSEREQETLYTGTSIDIEAEPGTTLISYKIPSLIDHDNLLMTVIGSLSGGRLGIEWCHSKRGKFRPITWAEPGDDGSIILDRIRSVRTTAEYRLVVEVGETGSAALQIDKCFGELEPVLKVHVNQVGYNVGQPKTFTVESNGSLSGQGTFKVIAPIIGPKQEFVTVYEGELAAPEHIELWGRYCLRGDFNGFDTPGNYFIEATVDDLLAESPVFSLDANFVAKRTLDPSHRFFWYQRCGMAIPGWHEACHTDDRITTPEGVSIETAGAWHDAGDYNKYNGHTPMSVYSLLYGYEFGSQYHQTQRHTGRPDILDEALWGADYLRKMNDPVTGKLWFQNSSGYGYWGIPEKETDNRIGGDDDRVATKDTLSHWMVAAFASIGRMTGNEEYLGRALTHWSLLYDPDEGADKRTGLTLLTAMELGKATGDPEYDKIQEACARYIVSCQGADDQFDGFYASKPGGPPACASVGEGTSAAILTLWLLANPKHSFAKEASASLDRYIGFLVQLSDNPYGVCKFYTGESLSYFMSYERDGSWNVGQNSQYLSNAWAAFLIHRATGNAEALRVGLCQVNWVLGNNPYGMCMMQDEGRVNPAAGHHRYNTIVGQPRGTAPGSVYNGLIRWGPDVDLPLFDLIEQGTPRYACNEPWIPHNSYWLFAMTELAAIQA
jgi:hypothetical protein